MEGLFTKGAEILFSQGVLGIVVIGLAYAYWNCRQQVHQATERHLADVKAVLETIHSNNVAISNVVEATKARSETAAAIAKAQEMAAAEQARNSVELAKLREAAEREAAQSEALTREIAALRATLNNGRGGA